jgi:NitT/TauT family transport system permease protein
LKTELDIKWSILPLLALLLSWWGLSVWLTPQVFPGPLETGRVLVEIVLDGDVFFHFYATLRRIFFSFIIAMFIGSIFGLLMGLFVPMNRLLNPSLIIGLNIPALITSVVLYIALGLNELAAVLAVALNKIPLVVVMIREGTKALDPKLFEMAKIFEIPRNKVLRKIVLPQLVPYFMAAARSGLSLIWKIVLVIEFLGRGDGVGFQIHLFFQEYEIAHILSYTILLIGIMLFIDYLVINPIERKLTSWRAPYHHGT